MTSPMLQVLRARFRVSAIEAHPTISFRYDIQGLRAVAVTLVILNHAFTWPSGGYLGVDIFYMISGYLISGLLLKEEKATGGVSFRAFYARRIRRIVPAAAFVIGFSVAAAYLLWFAPQAAQVGLDALASLLFVENWHLIAAGVDYLQASGPVSPLQSYWSLAVEEQFYALWPVLLMIILRVLRRVRRSPSLPVAIGTLLVLAVIYSGFATQLSPAAAYFNSAARGWELLAGAFLAAIRAPEWSARAKTTLSSFGMLLILTGALLLGDDTPMPWPGGAVAVVGAAAIIVANGDGGLAVILRNRPAQYVGRISYSLYLWHFPVLIFVRSITGAWWAALAALAAIIALSHLTYRYIEVPGQRLPLLRRMGRIPYRRGNRQDLLVALIALVVIAGLSLLQLRGPAWVRDEAALASRLGQAQVDPLASGENAPTAQQLDALILAADRERAWSPQERRMLERNNANVQAEAMQTVAPGCRNSPGDPTPSICRYGPDGASKNVLVLGDSVAMSWVPTVRAAYEPHGWGVQALGFASCSVMQVDALARVSSTAFVHSCSESRNLMIDLARRTRPDVLILSGDEAAFSRLADGAVGSAAHHEWVAGISATIRAVSPYVGRVVVLGNPPVGADMRACATRPSEPADCAGPPTADFLSMRSAEIEGVAQARRPETQYVDPYGWFCGEGICPPAIDNVILRTDSTHLTARAAVLVSRAFASAVGE